VTRVEDYAGLQFEKQNIVQRHSSISMGIGAPTLASSTASPVGTNTTKNGRKVSVPR